MGDLSDDIRYDGRLFRLPHESVWHRDGQDPRHAGFHSYVRYTFDHAEPVKESESHWYRYRECSMISSSYDMNGEWVRDHHLGTRVELDTYRVIRATPKGVWLDSRMGERFVLRGSRKQYACPTKEAALASFMARKRRQIRILEGQLQRAREALAAGNAESDALASPPEEEEPYVTHHPTCCGDCVRYLDGTLSCNIS